MKQIHVIKVGGAVLNDPERIENLLAKLARLEDPFVLVHGGGRSVDEWLMRLGRKPNMVDGRRITDAATLELAVMHYAGLLNKQMVANLHKYGKRALGLTGADFDSIRAIKRNHPTIDFGFVGDIVRVDGSIYHDLCVQGVTPVCCAITHDGQGQLLNTNADTIAAQIAIALARIINVELWYAFEKEGVLLDISDETSVISELSLDRYQSLEAGGHIHSGMKPKLHNCIEALHHGVKKVYICSAEALESIPKPGGTRITL